MAISCDRNSRFASGPRRSFSASSVGCAIGCRVSRESLDLGQAGAKVACRGIGRDRARETKIVGPIPGKPERIGQERLDVPVHVPEIGTGNAGN